MSDNKKKSTDDLLEELKKKSTNLDEYISSNAESLIEISLREYWEGLYQKSGKTKADVINNADISYIYFYEILQGKKSPTKDKIIRLILAMELPLEDCQNALRFCNQAMLYPRIKRDSILIYAITNRMTVYETQALLKKAGEEELK